MRDRSEETVLVARDPAESQTAPRVALEAALAAGATGTLFALSPVGALRVYLMMGEVVAAHTDNDDACLLARLDGANLLSAAERARLEARLAGGLSLLGALPEFVAEDAVQELFFERFRENLCDFLRAPGAAPFEELEAIFADNMQVGHDSRAVLRELVAVNARIAPLRQRPDLLLAAGPAPALADPERYILVRSATYPRLGDLLARSGLEPARTLQVVQDMLDRGALVVKEPVAAPQPVAPPKPVPTPKPVAPPQPVPPPQPVASPQPVAPARTPEELRRAIFSATPDEHADLAAFQDYDSFRQGGAFSADRGLLDRVAVEPTPTAAKGRPAAPAAPTAADASLEMAEADAEAVSRSAISLNFSGPKLHDEEVRRKLDVTNDVLATIAAALEAVGGSGSGQARVQLLVEGTSPAHAPLFKGIEVTADGRLPADAVTRNLRRRPAGEHRRLLNGALDDLIGRALSVASEVLDDAALEAMLEQIAGYQQRLGF